MRQSERNSDTRGSSRWKIWLSWCGGAAAIVALALAARFLSAPGNAQAQAPGNRPAARTASRTPAARPAPTAPAPRTPAAVVPPPKAVAGPAAPQPNVVAVVNGKTITRDQLAHECLRRFGEEVIEGLVNKELISYVCQQRGVVVSEQDVDDEIDRTAAKFGLSTDRWLQLLQDERSISASEYRREVIWPMLALRRLAANDIEVSPEELRQAFESEYGPKVKSRIIVTSTRAAAEKLLAMVKADPDSFGDVAKNHSEDRNSASARGLIPPIRKHMGSKELEDVAFQLEEGQVSGILEVANQFIIVKCERRLPETYVASQNLKEVEDRLRDSIRDQKLREAASKMFKQLQDEAKVVNVYNDPQRRQQMPGVAATINGQPLPLQQVADECVLRHGADVLDGEVNRALLMQALEQKGVAVTEQDIDEEIRRAADMYGFLKPDGTPDVEAWLKYVTTEGGEHVTVDIYVADAVWPSVALKKLVGGTAPITEEELQKGFEANYGERVEVLGIVLNNQRRAQQVWEMARSNPTDQFFGDLATQYSIEPVSRANSGKVPPVRRHGGSELIETEAFRLKPGEMSGVIVVGDRYIILRCLGRTTPLVKELTVVRAELSKELQEQKLRAEMTKEFDRLKETAKVQTYLTGVVTRGKSSQTALNR